MNFDDKRVLITGAAGGIGYALAEQLLIDGARVLLVGRNADALDAALLRLGVGPERATAFQADLTIAEDRRRVGERARHWLGGIDVLINNAGVSDFVLLEESTPEEIDRALTTNLLAPIDLSRLLLPHLRQRPDAVIVNIGSALGSVGLAGNATYCATKFGLRGFSEALRRELADSKVQVCYFAPRATQTAINSPAANAANAELGVSVDAPQAVARQMLQWLRSGRTRGAIGWPERFFARVNALLPSLVDRAVRSHLAIIIKHARRAKISGAYLGTTGPGGSGRSESRFSPARAPCPEPRVPSTLDPVR